MKIGGIFMQLQKNLAIALGKIRAQKNQSVTSFSELLGIARSSLQMLLKGRGNPRLDTVEYIAEKLQVSPSVLLSGGDSREPTLALEYLLQTIESVSRLPMERQRQIAALLQELVSLWNLTPCGI